MSAQLPLTLDRFACVASIPLRLRRRPMVVRITTDLGDYEVFVHGSAEAQGVEFAALACGFKFEIEVQDGPSCPRR